MSFASEPEQQKKTFGKVVLGAFRMSISRQDRSPARAPWDRTDDRMAAAPWPSSPPRPAAFRLQSKRCRPQAGNQLDVFPTVLVIDVDAVAAADDEQLGAFQRPLVGVWMQRKGLVPCRRRVRQRVHEPSSPFGCGAPHASSLHAAGRSTDVCFSARLAMLHPEIGKAAPLLRQRAPEHALPAFRRNRLARTGPRWHIGGMSRASSFQSPRVRRGRAGSVLVAASLASVVGAGLLLWHRSGDAVFADMVSAAIAWCF